MVHQATVVDLVDHQGVEPDEGHRVEVDDPAQMIVGGPWKIDPGPEGRPDVVIAGHGQNRHPQRGQQIEDQLHLLVGSEVGEIPGYEYGVGFDRLGAQPLHGLSQPIVVVDIEFAPVVRPDDVGVAQLGQKEAHPPDPTTLRLTTRSPSSSTDTPYCSNPLPSAG